MVPSAWGLKSAEQNLLSLGVTKRLNMGRAVDVGYMVKGVNSPLYFTNQQQTSGNLQWSLNPLTCMSLGCGGVHKLHTDSVWGSGLSLSHWCCAAVILPAAALCCSILFFSGTPLWLSETCVHSSYANSEVAAYANVGTIDLSMDGAGSARQGGQVNG